jgi:preprotein translocase subunit SecA
MDPLVAFKREGYDMFKQLQENIRRQVARTVFKVRVEAAQQATATARPPQQPQPNGQATGETAASGPTAQPVLAASTAPDAGKLRTNRGDGGEPAPAAAKATRGAAATATPKLGRNDPCFCGSGKKYKKCHGALA